MRRRDAAHHIKGYSPAILDRFAKGVNSFVTGDGIVSGISAYVVIRGREQQMIDLHGGSRSDGNKKSPNAIRGVAKLNPLGRLYHAASSAAFGQVADYTDY